MQLHFCGTALCRSCRHTSTQLRKDMQGEESGLLVDWRGHGTPRMAGVGTEHIACAARRRMAGVGMTRMCTCTDVDNVPSQAVFLSFPPKCLLCRRDESDGGTAAVLIRM
jgi:hypothetical protein